MSRPHDDRGTVIRFPRKPKALAMSETEFDHRIISMLDRAIDQSNASLHPRRVTSVLGRLMRNGDFEAASMLHLAMRLHELDRKRLGQQTEKLRRLQAKLAELDSLINPAP